jgi:type IV pilus assembly protein PilY1
MKQERINTGQYQLLAGAALCVLMSLGSPAAVSAQNMSDYTNYPIFLNQTVPPNILFLVDMGNATLEAAYEGVTYKTTTQQYPISFKGGTATSNLYAANVTVTSASGDSLVAVDNSGNAITAATVTSPADVFNPNQSYYGIFNPLRCYTTNSTNFIYGAVKANLSDACAGTNWDGNFLNWLTMRKQEVIYQVLVGGRPIPAQSNVDGTANTLAGVQMTGENGSTNTCSSNAKSCWRYVKFVPSTTLTGRVPSSLPAPTVNLSAGTVSSGRFFGSGEGIIYVNDDATASPFDNTPGNRYSIQVDLTTEPNVPSGVGITGNCFPGDPNYAGWTICYQRTWSLGLFQTMQTNNMHVGVMFVNASTGQGGSLQFPFDGNFNASAVTNLRNTLLQSYTPVSEAMYESLCLYAKSQGPCYSNSGSWSTGYNSSIDVAGDPFFYASFNQEIRCCKNYVLLISPGVTSSDGNAPDLKQPFGNPFSSTASNIGIVSSAAGGDRLDDIAYYGRTHDLRSDLAGTQFVSLYSVNAMGGQAGATLLASAAEYGGFQDLNGDNAIALSGTQTCTYPASSNLGTGSSTSNPEWDSNADCVPDTFFDASDGGGLQSQINNAINAILKQAASGTSISVLASSSSGDGSIYQAFFYPMTPGQNNNNISWLGYLQGLWVDSFGNLREDRGGAGGGPDGRHVYKDDDIIQTRLDPITNTVLVDCFKDLNEDGVPDTATPYQTITLPQVQGLWEAGKQLALRDLSGDPRNLITWVDKNNDGVVTSDEQMDFSAANATTLAPYLRASSSGTYTAANIISFLQGNQVTNMRDRRILVNGSYQTWRLGDIVHSTPTIVGTPQERYDILYGDPGYQQFLQRWSARRRVAYVGANDGMLHAFNAGFYHRGDDPNTSAVEHGWYTTAQNDNSSGPPLGEELWAFIPYYLLPQLMWYTMPEYTHVSYVDLKPKITDVHLWGNGEPACGGGTTPTAAGCIHAGGWGTVLILGLRFGGSCGSCASVSGTSNGGPPLSVTAKFDGSTTTTRTFYSGYIVLDITNPEASPTVLSAYSSSNLGLTTSYPTVVRMSPKEATKTDQTNAVFSMVLGSGVQGYDGRAVTGANLFAVQLVQQGTAPSATTMPVGASAYGSFMSDLITFDRDLDFRSDVVYVGRSIDPNAGAPSNVGYWWGKYYRLTMGTCSITLLPCSTSTWGVLNGATRSATEMIAQLTIGGSPALLGPMTTGSTVTLDNSGNTWVFFGTGRFFSNADKIDQHAQYLVGVKDAVVGGTCTQSTTTNCWDQNLLNVTNAAICVSCSSGNQVQGVGTVTTFSDLVTQIQGNSAGIPAMDGWFIQLATNAGSTTLGAERSVVDPTLVAGAVFFPTFIPSYDICVSTGTSNLYALYYLTGTGYTDPIIGVDAAGKAVTKVGMGQGLSSSVAIQIGSEPTGMAGFVQSSNSSIIKVSPKPPISLFSQYISWMSERS